jgi:hypothetical protein
VRWVGEFQMRPGGGWRSFTAEQHFTAHPPGFVWDRDGAWAVRPPSDLCAARGRLRPAVCTANPDR